MSDRFHPISMEQLSRWAFTELESKRSLFGVPESAFFRPRDDDRFRLRKYGYQLETPFGVAAGPQSQMAQNLVLAWLGGGRIMELKTVQIDDELVIAHRQRGLDPNHPFMRGTAQNPDTFFQAREACNPFYDVVPDNVQAAMDRFAALVGRRRWTRGQGQLHRERDGQVPRLCVTRLDDEASGRRR